MPTQIFSSFEAFFDSNVHSDVRGMVLGRPHLDWVMTQMAINKSSVQWGCAGTKVVVEGAVKPGGVTKRPEGQLAGPGPNGLGPLSLN